MKIASERPQDHEDIAGILRRQRQSVEFAELDRMIVALAADAADPTIADRYRSAKRSAGLEA